MGAHPARDVLAWGLPDHDLGAMLLNRPVLVPAIAAGRDVESMFRSWQRDFADDGAELIAGLEAQAFVRRLLRHHRTRSTSGRTAGTGRPAWTG